MREARERRPLSHAGGFRLSAECPGTLTPTKCPRRGVAEAWRAAGLMRRSRRVAGAGGDYEKRGAGG